MRKILMGGLLALSSLVPSGTAGALPDPVGTVAGASHASVAYEFHEHEQADGTTRYTAGLVAAERSLHGDMALLYQEEWECPASSDEPCRAVFYRFGSGRIPAGDYDAAPLGEASLDTVLTVEVFRSGEGISEEDVRVSARWAPDGRPHADDVGVSASTGECWTDVSAQALATRPASATVTVDGASMDPTFSELALLASGSAGLFACLPS